VTTLNQSPVHAVQFHTTFAVLQQALIDGHNAVRFQHCLRINRNEGRCRQSKACRISM